MIYFYCFLYFLVGYMVVRFAHRKMEKLPNLAVGIIGILFWPIVLVIMFVIVICLREQSGKDRLVDKLF
jgi:Na+/proline symporter